jgi:hypothetical protein
LRLLKASASRDGLTPGVDGAARSASVRACPLGLPLTAIPVRLLPCARRQPRLDRINLSSALERHRPKQRSRDREPARRSAGAWPLKKLQKLPLKLRHNQHLSNDSRSAAL